MATVALGRRRGKVGRNLRRDRRLMAAFGSAGVVATAVLGVRMANAGPLIPDVVSLQASPADGIVDITFAGDTLLGDGAAPIIAANGMDALLAKAAPLLAGDVSIVNAEAPITTVTTRGNPGQKFSYAADPSAVPALARAGVDVVSLSNNHSMDRGADGLRDTIANVTAGGLLAVGGGSTIAEAERPLIISAPAEKVGVVAFGENFGALYRADAVTPGIVSLTPAHIERGAALARAAGATRLIALVHWGDNYTPVNQQQRYWASVLVDAGFDVVIGAGAHIVHPIEVVKGRPVVYGMGNFVFGTPGRFDSFGQVGQGLTVSVRFTSDGHGQLTTRCLDTDNAKMSYISRPCTSATLPTVRKAVGPAVVWSGGVGRLAF